MVCEKLWPQCVNYAENKCLVITSRDARSNSLATHYHCHHNCYGHRYYGNILVTITVVINILYAVTCCCVVQLKKMSHLCQHVLLIWNLFASSGCDFATHAMPMALGYALFYIDDLERDCSNSSALAMELLRSCAKPSICSLWGFVMVRFSLGNSNFSWTVVLPRNVPECPLRTR